MKIKIFSGAYGEREQLEKEVNEFIARKNVGAVDIKFTETMAYNSSADDMEGRHSVMVTYEESRSKRPPAVG